MNQLNSVKQAQGQGAAINMNRLSVEHYVVGQYFPNWFQEVLKLDAVQVMKALSMEQFADRSAEYMKYRGQPITRSKLFAVESLDKVPVYNYPGFQYLQIKNEYRLISDFPLFQSIQRAITETFDYKTNHVIGTLYQNESDSIGWHNDKPKTIDPTVPIFIFSFGAQRPLLFRKNQTTEVVASIPMAPGSLFILDAATNSEYQHCIAASSTESYGPRISLIFRQITKQVTTAEIDKKLLQNEQRKIKEQAGKEIKAAVKAVEVAAKLLKDKKRKASVGASVVDKPVTKTHRKHY